MGDATNTAARVMGKSPPGHVLATTAVWDRTRLVFDLDPLEPFTVKGKREPLRAALVGEPVGERTDTVVEDVPLIGRDAEFGERWSRASPRRAPAGRVVELGGPRGYRQEPARAGDLGASPGTPGRDHRGRAVLGVDSPYSALRPASAPTRAGPAPQEGPDDQTAVRRPRATVAREMPELQERPPLSCGIPLPTRGSRRPSALRPWPRSSPAHAGTPRPAAGRPAGPCSALDPSLLLDPGTPDWLDEASADLLQPSGRACRATAPAWWS